MSNDDIYAGTLAILSAMAKKGYAFLRAETDRKLVFAGDNCIKSFDSWEAAAAFAAKGEN